LSTASFIFSKLVRKIIKFWRSKHLKVVAYLDDGIGEAETFENAYKDSKSIQVDLSKFGFIIAEEKCQWVPVQNLVWLGLEWDMKEGKLRVTQECVDKILRCIESLVLQIKQHSFRLVSVKFLASIIGQIISIQSVMGEEVRLRTRYAYECILERASWKAPVQVSKEAEGEFIFWYQNIKKMNERDSYLCQLTDDETYDANIFCDASGMGYCGYIHL
jgi:hypothetical protein